VPLDLRTPDGAFSPSFAATGTALFFHAGRDRDGRLLAADLNTQGSPLQIVTMLADGAKNYHPRLSPDERLIAFDSDRDGERAVYIARRDGSEVRRMSGAGFAAIPTWSPDMQWLTFVRAEPNQSKVWNLWRRNLATGELRRLTSYRYGQTWGASWFPDARRICYSHENQVVVLDIETGTIESFRSPRGNRLLRTPAVSPDGGRIVFQMYRDGVWLLDLQTREMRRIIDDPTAEEFAWNPQGTRVAYHSRRGGDWRIWVTTAPS
jgi:Tol biopolymer transport system component